MSHSQELAEQAEVAVSVTPRRRDFLSLAVAGGCAACMACMDAGAQTEPGSGPTTTPSTDPSTRPTGAGPRVGAKVFEVGKTSDYPKDGVTSTFARTNKVNIVRLEGKLYAVSSMCTHKTCSVKPADGGFRCPCHGSEFNALGALSKGPAKIALPHYGLSEKAGKLVVDMTQQFDEQEWESDGAFVEVKG